MNARKAICAVGLLAASGLVGCTTTTQGLRAKNQQQAILINELTRDKGLLQERVRVLTEEAETTSKKTADVTREREDLTQKLGKFQEDADRELVRQQTLKSKLVVALKEQNCEVLSRGRDVVVRAAVGFIPGGTEVDKDGQTLLRAIADAVRGAAPGYALRVEGHTDDTPIQKAEFPSNWELSGARAASALRFLVDRCSLPAEQISFAGYGEYMPVVPNTDVKSRARNRRIEIVVLAKD